MRPWAVGSVDVWSRRGDQERAERLSGRQGAHGADTRLVRETLKLWMNSPSPGVVADTVIGWLGAAPARVPAIAVAVVGRPPPPVRAMRSG